ncbi:MAG: NAD(P)-binding domain-containing protein [Bacteroidota bacterium]|nr:NAD(P)-binding domain-containing protein [Bacteroidota bacterium]
MLAEDLKPKVLITDDVHFSLIPALETRNFHVDYLPDISLQETIERIHYYTGLIINSKINVDQELLDKATHLKWIARLGSGMEIIDLPLTQLKGIKVFNTPEANCNSVAEHALGMLLALLRNLPRADKEIREMQWFREKNRGEELRGKTLGIIGYGHTGTRFAEMLNGLNVKVLVFDKYKQLNIFTDRLEVVNDVRQIQEQADIISLHVPLTPETEYLIKADFIANCKKAFILINTSRGKVVNTHDLLLGLKEGKVRGACLDVFENEKPDSFSVEEKTMYGELYLMHNVVLSPHIAGWTHESKKAIADILLQKLDYINSKLEM